MKHARVTTLLAGALALAVAAPVAAQERTSGSSSHDDGSTMEERAVKAPTAKATTIVDVAASKEAFSTLVTAVKAAGLVETLSSEGPFTVFAPTNDAFAELPEGTLGALLEDKEKLTSILTYHVVAGKVTSDEVVGLERAATANGAELRIRAENGVVMINDATVIQADVMADNGVIHVIDTVLLPPEE